MNQAPLTLTDLSRALQRRLGLLLLIFVTIVGAGMAVTLLVPPTYQSTMKIFITRNRLDPQVSASDKNNDMQRGELTEEDFNSELEILQSRAVIEATARQLSIGQPFAAPAPAAENSGFGFGSWYRSLHQQTPAPPLEKAVAQVSSNLEAVALKKSRILQVTYQDSSPERAAQVLQALYQNYADHHLQLHQSAKAAQVFREQSEAFNQKLKEATDALKRFDVANGLAGSPAQRELLLQQFYLLQQQFNQTRTEQLETRQRLTILQQQVAQTPERIQTEVRTKYTGARDRIKDEILALEMQSAQLRQKYVPTHRLVKEVEERLAQARKLLAREEQTPPQEIATMPNELHRRLTGEVLSAQSNLAALDERQQRLAALTKQYQTQIATFDVKSLERSELERARNVQEEAYLLYRKKAQEAEISNLMNQARIANISLAQPPTVNHKPVNPKPLLNLAVLSVIGLLAGVATALTLERRRLGVAPVAVALPRSTTWTPQLEAGQVASANLGLAIDRLQQREQQLLAETAAAQIQGQRTPRPVTNVKSLTFLRHHLRRNSQKGTRV